MIQWMGMNFSCERCIKGHRTWRCSHLDRSLLEVRGKGRPSTQCSTCRSKRSTSSHHGGCRCGDGPPSRTISRLLVSFLSHPGLTLSFLASSVASSSSMAPASSPNTLAESLLASTPPLYTLLSKNNPLIQNQQQQSPVDNGPTEVSASRDSSVPQEAQVGDVQILQEPVPQEEYDKRILNNPCQCYSGGDCICSVLYKSVKEKRGRSKTQVEEQESACGCMSTSQGCQCPTGGCQCPGGSCCPTIPVPSSGTVLDVGLDARLDTTPATTTTETVGSSTDCPDPSFPVKKLKMAPTSCGGCSSGTTTTSTTIPRIIDALKERTSGQERIEEVLEEEEDATEKILQDTLP